MAARLMLVGMLAARAAFGEGAICRSERSAFTTNAPPGWRADFEAAKRMGLCVVYVLQGSSFDSSAVVIYPNLVAFARKRADGSLDLDDFIARDVDTFRVRNASLKVRKLPDVVTTSGLRFSARIFEGGRPPNEIEEVVYADGEDAVFMAVYSGHDRAAFERHRASFARFLDGAFRTARGPSAHGEEQRRAVADAARAPGFEGSFISTLAGGPLGAAMSACAKTGDSGFDAVLQISREGVIAGITFAREDDLFRCMEQRLVGQRGPSPPFAPFHVHLDMRVKP